MSQRNVAIFVICYFSIKIFLDKMNRKTAPVSSTTLRWRTCVDVDKRLKQIRDDCSNVTDCQMTVELGDAEFFEENLHFTESQVKLQLSLVMRKGTWK